MIPKEIVDIRYLWSIISRSGPCSLERYPFLIIGLKASFLKGWRKGDISIFIPFVFVNNSCGLTMNVIIIFKSLVVSRRR